MKKSTTTTPDPEMSTPLGTETDPAGCLGGQNPRGEVTACPTGLADAEQVQQAQRAGGGAPGTGDADKELEESDP